jgi:ankyrin repeat protein
MNTLIGQPTKGDIKQTLQHLAKGLDGLDKTYEQAMERINNQGIRIRGLANRILAWITHAKRPLSTAELQHALCVRPGTAGLDKDYLPSVQSLRSFCAGLVTIDEQSGIVRLVHYTTQQYFERKWTSWFPDAQTDITNVCVTYLSFNVFETGFCQSDKEFESRLQTNVLYDYAARYWGYHARTASVEEGLILGLLQNSARVAAASQAMLAFRDYYYGYSQRVPTQVTGLHVAAYFGLGRAMISLLNNDYNSDLYDSEDRTPLSWAAEYGYEEVVRMLLGEGAKLESKDKSGRTPLSLAARFGHEEVVRLLLERGAELESRANYGKTPLLFVAESGHEGVVRLLLERGAGLESRTNLGRTPLLFAAECGHEGVVRLLLERGAGLESRTDSGQTSLSYAARSGHKGVVRLLLERGARLKSRTNHGKTPLSFAAEFGHEGVARLLLEKGAELEPQDNSGWTPLSLAALKGREEVVRLLLKKGDELESRGVDRRMPVLWAARNGHDAVVRLLLEKGASL